jgi:hypothetical protein
MPLKVCVGLTKKEGLPNYGSIGANCHVEVELDNGLLCDDLESFHRHIRNAYVACAQAVNDELTRQRSGEANGTANSQSSPSPHHHADHRANHHSNSHGSNGHQASEKQIKYAQQLAREIRDLGDRRLDTVTQKMFDKPLAALSSLEASGLIDCLKGIKEGNIRLEDALNGAAT